MENNKLPNDTIDDFIMGILNKEEDQQFRKRMKEDMDLQEQVKLRREMIDGVEAYGRKELKAQLKEIHEEVVASSTVTPAKRWRLLPYIAAAAAILLLALAIPWLMDGGVNNTPEGLYATYFSPYDISGAQRNNADPQLLELETLYSTQKYKEVLPLLEAQINKSNPKPSYLLLAAGIAQLELGQPEKALWYFQRISAVNDFTFEDEVHWYTALAHLKGKDVAAAKVALQGLVKDANADHYEEAKELLEKLD